MTDTPQDLIGLIHLALGRISDDPLAVESSGWLEVGRKIGSAELALFPCASYAAGEEGDDHRNGDVLRRQVRHALAVAAKARAWTIQEPVRATLAA